MNSANIKSVPSSTKPALELIALAQLSPQLACQRLRALLLVNPNYFRNVPPSSFKTVLNIQEDTTYESLSNVTYDPLFQQLRAAITMKQPNGYSDNALNNGSEEFVRFYVSYDGGLRWLDQGMRLVNVFDAQTLRPRTLDVTQQIIPLDELCPTGVLPRVRAILSWNAPPPTLASDWKPVWGNVVECSIRMQDSRVIFPGRLQSLAYAELRGASQQATMNLKQPVKRPVQGGESHLRVDSRQSKIASRSHSMATMLSGGAGTAGRVFKTLKSVLKISSVAVNCL